MPFIESILAFGVVPFIALCIFLSLMAISIGYDRQERNQPKWYVLGLAVLGFVLYGWTKLGWNLNSVWTFISSSTVWQNAAIYLLIGLAYSVIEFVFEVRRAARYFAEKWSQPVHVPSGFAKEIESIEARRAAYFVSCYAPDKSDAVIGIKLDSTGTAPVPAINKAALAEHIGAWTFLWPFYAMNLVFGNLFIELFRVFGDCIAKLFDKYVRRSFANVFANKN